MILVWPPHIEALHFIRTVSFADEPKIWWWTNVHALLLGVGERPDDFVRIKPTKNFAEVAALDVKRVKTKWERRQNSFGLETVRSLKNESHGIDVRYYRLLEHWPKPVKWLVPEKDRWGNAALAIEVESQQIVAAIMPMRGADRWETR